MDPYQQQQQQFQVQYQQQQQPAIDVGPPPLATKDGQNDAGKADAEVRQIHNEKGEVPLVTSSEEMEAAAAATPNRLVSIPLNTLVLNNNNSTTNTASTTYTQQLQQQNHQADNNKITPQVTDVDESHKITVPEPALIINHAGGSSVSSDDMNVNGNTIQQQQHQQITTTTTAITTMVGPSVVVPVNSDQDHQTVAAVVATTNGQGHQSNSTAEEPNLPKDYPFITQAGSNFIYPPPDMEMKVDDILIKVKYCLVCNIWRPPRAAHCYNCNRCVDAHGKS